MSVVRSAASLGGELFANGRLALLSQQFTSLRSFRSQFGLRNGESTATRATDASLPRWTGLLSLIPSLADVLLLAAPKQKVTPHRKGKRSATKGIRFIPIAAQCSKCDRVFPPHAMPSKCDEVGCPAFNLRERPASSFKEQPQTADE